MPSFTCFTLATIAVILCQPTKVIGVETQCVVDKPSNICPASPTYADARCGVQADPVALYCSTDVSLLFQDGSKAPDNLYENCAPTITKSSDCCLAPTQEGGIRLIDFDNKFVNPNGVDSNLFVVTQFDYVTAGVPIFDINIRGFQLSPFDLRDFAMNATTCNGTQVYVGSLILYIAANHEQDSFTVTMSASDGLVPQWSTSFSLLRTGGGGLSAVVYNIAYAPSIRRDVSDAGTIMTPGTRPLYVYIPTQAPTLVPTTPAPTAPTATPTAIPTLVPSVRPTSKTTAALTVTPSATSSISPTKAPNINDDGNAWLWPVVACGVTFCFGMLCFAFWRTYRPNDGENYMTPYTKQASANGFATATENPLGAPPTIQEIAAESPRASTGMFGYLLWGDRARSGQSGRGGPGSVSEFSTNQRGGRRNRAGTEKSRDTMATAGTRDTITSYIWSGVFSIRSKPKSTAQNHKQSDRNMSSVELREY